jgi:FkbM family methyltransferase
MVKLDPIWRRLRYYGRRLRRPSYMTLDDVRLHVDTPNLSSKLRQVIYRENYEVEERRILRGSLRSEDRVLELGAGIGLLSILCCRILKDDQRVLAFEANSVIAEEARRNFARNGVAPRLETGLVTADGASVEFHVNQDFWSSSIVARPRSTKVQPMHSIALSTLLETFRPTYLLVDVEGAEYDLFRKSSLPGVVRLCLEIHPHVIGNRKCSEVVRHLLEVGFNWHVDLSTGRSLLFERDDDQATLSSAMAAPRRPLPSQSAHEPTAGRGYCE